jgi:hypothetical protein
MGIKRKWHYYNSKDDLCNFKVNFPMVKDKIVKQTACGRRIMKVLPDDFRHTEFKGRVDCLLCLRRLNKMELFREGQRKL